MKNSLRIAHANNGNLVSQSVRVSLPVVVAKEMQLYCQLGTLTPNQFVEGAIQDLLKHDRVFRRYIKENPEAANAIDINPGKPSETKGK